MALYLDDALLSMWEAACNAEDGDHAACVLYWLCAKDPSFKPPWWLLCRFKAHRAAIIESFGDGPVHP